MAVTELVVATTICAVGGTLSAIIKYVAISKYTAMATAVMEEDKNRHRYAPYGDANYGDGEGQEQTQMRAMLPGWYFFFGAVEDKGHDWEETVTSSLTVPSRTTIANRRK